VAKVKKPGAVRRAQVKRPTKLKRVTSGAPKPLRRKPVTRKGKGRTAPPKVAAPVVKFHVRELDPQRKCGPATSVQLLYRINEESTDGQTRSHMVFFDRHGWYCEHGRDCPAVKHARKIGDGARLHGPNQNGRMRA
jgi:hypothetical protein